jgi:hypothetical protein
LIITLGNVPTLGTTIFSGTSGTVTVKRPSSAAAGYDAIWQSTCTAGSSITLSFADL